MLSLIFALVIIIAQPFNYRVSTYFPCVPETMETTHTDNPIYAAPGMPGYSALITCLAYTQTGQPYEATYYSHAGGWLPLLAGSAVRR